MAGLYVTFDRADRARLESVASRMKFADEADRIVLSEISYVWSSHDPESLYAPAIDAESGVHCVVAGRLAWPTDVLQGAERMPYEGGIANRVLLHKYLKDGPDDIVPFNGAATVLIWDPRVGVVRVWTDQFGYHPSFFYDDQSGIPLVFTSFPDAVLADPTLEVERDLVSMAEFLRAWRVTPPHTYFKNLKYAGAAARTDIGLRSKKVSRQTYWKPFEGEFYSSLADASDALAAALVVAIKERTAVSEKAAFFVSGGADSRVLLYAADDPVKVTGVNLYESSPTAESATAKALCERAGASYVGFGRDNDYYPRMLEENVRWSGAMWSAEDSHYLGVVDVVNEVGADLVMTACTTDWVFKGYGLEKEHRRFLGRNLPIKRFLDNRVDGFLPNYPLSAPSEFEEEIGARMSAWFSGTPTTLQTDLDRLLVEDRRVRPACYTVSVSGQIMYRTYPYDTFLADSRIADCYSRIPAKWKLNGEVWGLAAARVCANAADISDSNFGWAVDAGMPSKLLNFTKGWVRRRITPRQSAAHLEGHPPCYASWPDLGWYAKNSEALKSFWNDTSIEDKQLIERLLGFDAWDKGLEYWSTRANDLMRVLTLLQHWREGQRP